LPLFLLVELDYGVVLDDEGEAHVLAQGLGPEDDAVSLG
jgi:hypothetical protein